MKIYINFVCLLMLVTSLNAQQLKRKASLGFTPIPVDSSMIKDLKMEETAGILITQILPEGTFAGLKAQERDVLLKLNGQTTNDLPSLLAIRNELREKEQVEAQVLRNGISIMLNGLALGLPYETSEHSEVIYDQFDFDEGQIRTIVNKPKQAGKHPVIFFIPGYTCSSIDNFHPIHPYRKLIDAFVEKGYAVFRMEKPGMGDNENTGDCRQLGFHNELKSYFNGYEELKKYDFIDEENIFLWGHSMGGLYAPLIAAEKQPKGLAFYGMVHDSWTEYLLRMVRYQNPRIGASDYLQTDKDLRLLYAMLYKHYHEGVSSKELAKNEDYARILERDFWFDGENQILLRHEDFWRELYEYSLTEALVKYKGFLLSMNGEADLEVLNDFSQKEVVQIVNHYHKDKGTFHYFPKTDHSMIEVGTLEEGAVLRYQAKYRDLMENNFNYEIVEVTHDWIQDKLSKSIEEKKVMVIKDWYNKIDVAKLKNSSDYYDIVWKGKVSGSMSYHKKIEDGQLIIKDTSELKEVVWEELKMSYDLEQKRMLSGQVALNYFQQNTQLNGTVQWENDAVKCDYTVNQQGVERKIPVEIEAEEHLLGRGAIFGLLPSLPIALNQEYELDFFSFPQAERSKVKLKVEEKTTIDWRGQQKEVLRLSLTGGQVDNIIYMDANGTGQLYQIDVVGQDMRIVLRR